MRGAERERERERERFYFPKNQKRGGVSREDNSKF